MSSCPEIIRVRNIITVAEQEQPDAISIVKSPNPEDPEALKLAIETAIRNGSDIVMATDPDADRLGIAVKNKEGDFIM